MVIVLFEKNPDNYKNLTVKLNYRSIDFKDKAVFLSTHLDNVDERYEFAEESSQKCDFRSDSSRFATNIATESLKHGNNGERNKLGMDWYNKKNGKKKQTLNQIGEGMKKQEYVKLLKT